MSHDNQQEKEKQIYRGGIDLEVTYDTPWEGHQGETILVREISHLHIDRLGLALGRLTEEIKLYTGRPDNWVHALTEDSYFAVLKEGRRINFRRLQSFAELHRQQMEILDPAAKEAEVALLEQLMQSLQKSQQAATEKSAPSS